ncbi:MAG TPA: transposase [Gallionellaceae bacterium]|nr:transposase [Gallionellaceae bacterium]
MARPIRLEFPDAIYHVTTRGNGGEDIFIDDQDRQQFLTVLGEVVFRAGWIVHAYVLMDNHYHLLIETPHGNLSRGMRQLNGVYTQRFNSLHGSGGRVFQGRFKAVLVERDGFLLELCRYIVLNPLRVKAVKNISRYRWSSYRATVGDVQPPVWLNTEWLLSHFGRNTAVAQRKYAEFVDAGIGLPSPLSKVKSQILLGSPAFIKKMKQRLLGSAGIKKSVRDKKQLRRPSLNSLFPVKVRKEKSLRNEAIKHAYQDYGYTMAAIADAAQIHFSTVSKVIKLGEQAA